jgi:hypothetical protein
MALQFHSAYRIEFQPPHPRYLQASATVRQIMLRNNITNLITTLLTENTKYALRAANPGPGVCRLKSVG